MTRCLILLLASAAMALSVVTAVPVGPSQASNDGCDLEDPVDFEESDCSIRTPPGQCVLPPRTCKFMRKGLAGGGTKHYCENTIQSAAEGVKQGANVLEVDICKSSDNVLFLWFDCNLQNSLAIARRLGHYVTGKCVPFVNESVPATVTHAGDLTFEEIQRWLGYKDDFCSRHRLDDVQIPTLETFLRRFANEDRVLRFNLDIKVRPQEVKDTTRRIWRLASCLAVSSKILLTYPDPQTVLLGQCALREMEADPREVSLDIDLNPDDFDKGNADMIRGNLSLLEKYINQNLLLFNGGVCPKAFRAGVMEKYNQLYARGLKDIAKIIFDPNLNPLIGMNPVQTCHNLCVRHCSLGIPRLPGGFEIMKKTTLKASLMSRPFISPNMHIAVFGVTNKKEAAYLIGKRVDSISHGNVRSLTGMEDLLKDAGCNWKCDLVTEPTNPFLPTGETTTGPVLTEPPTFLLN